MITAHVVELATEYLDQCSAKNQKATLVGMHWYIDGRDKTLPSLEEVNLALVQRSSIYVQRIDGNVAFASSGSERAVTNHDMKLADENYREEFPAALRKLKK